MNTSHWRLPADPLRTSVIGTQIAAIISDVALSVLARATLPVSGAFPLKTGVILATIFVVSLGRVEQHHPFPRFGPANQVTTVRIALVGLVASLIGEPAVPPLAAGAVAASSVVAVLDGVDGWLSR